MHDEKESVISFCAEMLGDQDFFSEDLLTKANRRILYDAKLLMRIAKVDKRVFVRCVEWGIRTPYGPRSLALSPMLKYNSFSILLEKDEEIRPGTPLFVVSETKMSEYRRDSEGKESFTFSENTGAVYASYVRENGVLKIRPLTYAALEIAKIEEQIKGGVAMYANLAESAVGGKKLRELFKTDRLEALCGCIRDWFDVEYSPTMEDTTMSISESIYKLKNKTL